jgi:septum formation protein
MFPIILASTSPRRIALLKQLDFKIEVHPPDVLEEPKAQEKPEKLVKRLAQEKAESVKNKVIQHYSCGLILAADTIVIAPEGGKILGKPRNSTEAKKMIQLLSGKTHTVLTGYCIDSIGTAAIGKKVVRAVKSRVKMRSLNRLDIQRYVSSGEPLDKAGSYAAQGLGMALIEKINGSYTNVVGLPIAQLLADLEKIFKIQLFSWVQLDLSHPSEHPRELS